MNKKITAVARRLAVGAALLAASGTALGDGLKSLTVCADPGNMPLSNQKGEGFENKIAQVIGTALGTGVQYYWRPSIERGLMRTTLSEGNCDLWMDMATDTEGAVVLAPLYRSTFVLAYRSDKGIDIKSLDDPALKKLRVGVFQVSAIRQALADHHVVSNTVIHYLSHNADIVANNQPSYQVQQVIDGGLDVAAAWGPMAGYYKAIVHAPLIIQPVNMMEDREQMEFDMALAVPRGRPDIKAAIEQAVEQHKGEIQQILTDFGVPLVKCEQCFVSGDLPSHGPYEPAKPEVQTAVDVKAQHARMADLKKWLAQGANPDDELSNAIVADDLDRVRYLLSHGAHINAVDGEGHPALVNASRLGSSASRLIWSSTRRTRTLPIEAAGRRSCMPRGTMIRIWPRCCSGRREARCCRFGRTDATRHRRSKWQVQSAPGVGGRGSRRQRAGRERRVYAVDAGIHFGLQRRRGAADRSRCEGERSESRRSHCVDDRSRRQSLARLSGCCSNPAPTSMHAARTDARRSASRKPTIARPSSRFWRRRHKAALPNQAKTIVR